MFFIFIADLHLKVSDLKLPYRNFNKFLNSIEKSCDNLYILGDFFTYWYEHSGVDFYSSNPVLKLLKAFKNKGKKIYFIYGNRDFAVGKYFMKYSGVDFIGEKLTISSGGKKILLTHGDEFMKNDIRYRIWRKFIRSSISLFVFKRLPVGYAIYIADKLSNISKSKYKEEVIANIIMEGARSRFSNHLNVIVMGHAHFKLHREWVGKKGKKELFIIPNFKFPGEFLTLQDGKFKYKKFG